MASYDTMQVTSLT